MPNTTIEMSEIEYSFNNKPILNKVNLSAEQGEIVGLIGPNGAGKTTIFNILSGSIKPNDGNIYINGVHKWLMIIKF